MLVDPGEQVIEVGSGEFPLEGSGGGVVGCSKSASRCSMWSRLVKSWGDEFALDDGEVNLDLIEPGCVHRGVHLTALGKRVASRSMAALTRCEEPLSTIQKTRLALA